MTGIHVPRDLRDALAAIYRTKDAVERVANDAKLNLDHAEITLTEMPRSNWQKVLRHAILMGLVEDVLDVAVEDGYGTHPQLVAAAATWRTGGRDQSGSQGAAPDERTPPIEREIRNDSQVEGNQRLGPGSGDGQPEPRAVHEGGAPSGPLASITAGLRRNPASAVVLASLAILTSLVVFIKFEVPHSWLLFIAAVLTVLAGVAILTLYKGERRLEWWLALVLTVLLPAAEVLWGLRVSEPPRPELREAGSPTRTTPSPVMGSPATHAPTRTEAKSAVSLPSGTPTETTAPSSSDEPTATQTPTVVATPEATLGPLETPVPPTATEAPVRPTVTPTLSRTATPSSTDKPTATHTPSKTPLAPTATKTSVTPTVMPAMPTSASTPAPTGSIAIRVQGLEGDRDSLNCLTLELLVSANGNDTVQATYPLQSHPDGIVTVPRGLAEWFRVIGKDKHCPWDDWTMHPDDPDYIEIKDTEITLVFQRTTPGAGGSSGGGGADGTIPTEPPETRRPTEPPEP